MPLQYDRMLQGDPGYMSLLQDGTAGVPSLSFFNSIHTGMYLSAPDAIGFSILGKHVVNFSAESGITVINTSDVNGASIIGISGTAVASEDNQAAYGVYGSASSTGGSNQVVWAGYFNGNVGIANGNVGFNFGTMLGWPTSGTFRAVQIGAYGGITGNTGNTQVNLTQNIYNTGSAWKYSIAGPEPGVVINLSAGGFYIYTAPSGAGGADATVTAKFLVDNAGNAGFNFGTMLAWPTSGNNKGFQLGVSSGILADIGSPNIVFLQNVYFDGSVYKYSSTAATSRIAMISGSISFVTAASGTINTQITTETTKFVIDNNGNMGWNFGTMNPWSTSGTTKGFQLGGYGGFFAATNNTTLTLAQNLYNDGSVWRRSSGNPGTLLTLYNGGFYLSTIATGSSGSDATAGTTDVFTVSPAGAAFTKSGTLSCVATGGGHNPVGYTPPVGSCGLFAIFSNDVSFAGGAVIGYWFYGASGGLGIIDISGLGYDVDVEIYSGQLSILMSADPGIMSWSILRMF